MLKTLRAQVEAVYVHWYLTHLTLAWGTFVDPAGPTSLLQRWRIDQVPNQHQFYQRHVKRRLDEADNRKVFVIISDAFRYEAAQELTQVLNGTYRFEGPHVPTGRAPLVHRAGYGQSATPSVPDLS